MLRSLSLAKPLAGLANTSLSSATAVVSGCPTPLRVCWTFSTTAIDRRRQGTKRAAEKARYRSAQVFAAARALAEEWTAADQQTSLQFPLLPAGTNSEQVYNGLRFTDVTSEGVRSRQHANPFTPALYKPPEVSWDTAYADPQRPLVLDIGCASGRFLLALSREVPSHNFLGLDIRHQLTKRANVWASTIGADDAVHFLYANATLTLAETLAAYPGPLALTTILCPDPCFKKRHHKRRIVQPQLVKAVVDRLMPGGYLFIESDVLEVALEMRTQFEQHAGNVLSLAQEHSQLATFEAENPWESEGPVPKGQPTAPELSAAQSPARPSSWAGSWLTHNPLGLQTEREISVLQRGLPMYRMLLQKSKQADSVGQ